MTRACWRTMACLLTLGLGSIVVWADDPPKPPARPALPPVAVNPAPPAVPAPPAFTNPAPTPMRVADLQPPAPDPAPPPAALPTPTVNEPTIPAPTPNPTMNEPPPVVQLPPMPEPKAEPPAPIQPDPPLMPPPTVPPLPSGYVATPLPPGPMTPPTMPAPPPAPPQMPAVAPAAHVEPTPAPAPPPPPVLTGVLASPPPPTSPFPWKLNVEVVNGLTQFELRQGDELLMKVQCERLDVRAPSEGLQALGKVTVTGPCVEARCDRLTIAWPSGQVALDGSVRLAFQNRGVVHEMRAESVGFRLNGAKEPLDFSTRDLTQR